MSESTKSSASSRPSDRIVLIVPHTHWDREWYWSLAGYRHRLIDLLDDVIGRLSNPDAPEGLPTFWMDGQVAPLLDYLESKPENAEVLRQLVAEDKLRIGPWFIQADEHLVDGESCVRNLLLGEYYGKTFGSLKRIGYLPDQFGHIAQMPQILRKAGIEAAVFWRGITPRSKNRLKWVGPDGSEVQVLWLQNGYSNAADLPETLAEAVERLEERVSADREYDADGVRLLMAGVDHALPAPILKQAAERLAAKLGVPVRIAGLDEVVAESQRGIASEPESICGELLYTTLSGTWSSRTYLKQANDRVSRILEQWSEPLAALALLVAGIDLRAELRTAWRELILNHPHDSICGCSIDEVHRAMMTRFEIAATLGRNVAKRAALALQLAAAEPHAKIDVLNRSINRIQDLTPEYITLWNFSGRPIAETILLDVIWPDQDASGVQITDAAGRPLPVQVVSHEPHRFRRWRPNANPTHHFGRKFSLAVKPAEPLAATGFTRLRIRPVTAEALADHTQAGQQSQGQEQAPASSAALRTELNRLENDILYLEIHPDGSCDLTHKPTGRTFRRLCTLADVGEAGDSYTHIQPIRDEQILPEPGTIATTAAGPLFGQIEVHTRMMLPAELSPDKRGRSRRRIACPLTIRYSLADGWPYARVDVEFDNRCKNHLLRALFPLGHPVERHYACVPLAGLERSALPVEWRDTDRGRAPIWPDGWGQLGWIDLPSREASLAIIAPGTVHYGIEPNGTCWLNLLRCFGELIWYWHPMYATPEGQCLGRQRFRLFLYPHALDHVTAQVQAVAEHAILGPHVTAGQTIPESLLEGSIVETSPGAVRLTAIKPAETDSAIVVRLLNDSQQPADARVRFRLPVKEIREVNLLEQPVSSDRLSRDSDASISMLMKPYELVTLLLKQ